MKRENFNDRKNTNKKIESIFDRKKEKVTKQIATSMWILVIATIPNILVAGYIFGVQVYWTIAFSVFFCMLFEYIYNALTHTKSDRKDISSVVTGIILAFLLPANIPVYALIVGCGFSIIVAKKLFGGQGHTVVNPAVAGALFMWSFFPVEMANLPYPTIASKIGGDIASTPWQNVVAGNNELIPSNIELVLGFVPGGIGSVSVVAIVVGGILLLLTRTISSAMVFSYLGTFVLLSMFLADRPEFLILNGSVYLAAFFLLGDPYTTPKATLRKIIYGVLCAVLSFFAILPAMTMDGILVAVLLMNIIGIRGKTDIVDVDVSKKVDVKVIEKETEAY